MVAKMEDMGHDVLYYENTEGGHAGAANNEHRANVYALIYTYLTMELMDNTDGWFFRFLLIKKPTRLLLIKYVGLSTSNKLTYSKVPRFRGCF